MRLDHVSYASESDGYVATAQRLSEALSVEPLDGGVHPRFGTRNLILPLSGGNYVEVVEALEHPAAQKTPFGQAVRTRSEAGGGWMGWVVSVNDLSAVEERLGRAAVPGNRTPPGCEELKWKQIGVKGLLADPQLPFFISWISADDKHPSASATTDVRIAGLQIAGDPLRVTDWLGEPVDKPLEEINVDWSAPRGTPGLMSVTFATPAGNVTI
ncbi:VOC family protein [Saxibacter everestensis]|uniref:VOC family protein n=1 Tax=Saxibacter everestensis TaxID=2909229 RepID=A0ABY8QPZ3_9MICO|nr:VOC family protein [Brevibacteriaceae bacterium ZFBP1038]